MDDPDLDLDIGLLKVVYHCFHAGGIKAAAPLLKCSETTVRDKLAAFEAICGFPLFQRQPWKPYPIAEFVVKTVAAPAVEGLASFYRDRHTLLRPHIRLGGPEYAL